MELRWHRVSKNLGILLQINSPWYECEDDGKSLCLAQNGISSTRPIAFPFVFTSCCVPIVLSLPRLQWFGEKFEKSRLPLVAISPKGITRSASVVPLSQSAPNQHRLENIVRAIQFLLAPVEPARCIFPLHKYMIGMPRFQPHRPMYIPRRLLC